MTTTLGNLGAATEKIVIADAVDWVKIGIGDVIIDPMVLRYGEVFLGGAAKAGEQANKKWRAIAADVGGLLLFFDQIMLRERIPVFNYGDTFDSGKNFAERVLASVNRSEEILVEVDVQYTPYWEAKAEALDQVREVLQERGPLPEDDLSREVVRHLSVFEYD
jgi:hypothetical protein